MPTPSMSEPLLLSRRLTPLPAAAGPAADVAGSPGGAVKQGLCGDAYPEGEASARDREEPLLVLALSATERQRLRGHCRSACGRDLLLQLPRGGGPLAPDERLADADGVARVRVAAAPEDLLRVRSDDPFTLLRAAYHLGNRHVALELRQGELRLLRDPVLAAMLGGLGVTVSSITAPFRPEGGAYGSGGHAHDHSHGHGHGHHTEGGHQQGRHEHSSHAPHSHGPGSCALDKRGQDSHTQASRTQDSLSHHDLQGPADPGDRKAPPRPVHGQPS